MKKEVKKTSKNSDFYFTIINKMKEGNSPAKISQDLNISKQKLNYYIRNLKNEGVIEKKGYGTWEVKKEVKKRSLGSAKPLTNLHALQIRFPILSGTIQDDDWEIKEKLKHWLPKYTSLKALGGLRIKNNNNKSITVWAEERNIENLEEIDKLSYQIRDYIYEYFRLKHNVELDKYDCEVKNLDIATEDKNAEGMRRKGEKFVINFDKQAEKVFKKDNMQSKAMIDGSPFNFSAETNDKEWKRAYLNMPFNMQKLMDATMYIAENYASHVGVVEKLNKLLDKGKKEIKRTILEKNQTKLSDFYQ